MKKTVIYALALASFTACQNPKPNPNTGAETNGIVAIETPKPVWHIKAGQETNFVRAIAQYMEKDTALVRKTLPLSFEIQYDESQKIYITEMSFNDPANDRANDPVHSIPFDLLKPFLE